MVLIAARRGSAACAWVASASPVRLIAGRIVSLAARNKRGKGIFASKQLRCFWTVQRWVGTLSHSAASAFWCERGAKALPLPWPVPN